MKSPPRAVPHSMLCGLSPTLMSVEESQAQRYFYLPGNPTRVGLNEIGKVGHLNKLNSEGTLHGWGKSLLEARWWLNKGSSTKDGLLPLVIRQRNPRGSRCRKKAVDDSAGCL